MPVGLPFAKIVRDTSHELSAEEAVKQEIVPISQKAAALARYKEQIELEKRSILTEPTEQDLKDIEDERVWQDYANCLGVDPDLFFPERGASTRESKEVCRGCIVREDCLEFALSYGEKFGIWGGMSERERRRLRRQRALAKRQVAQAAAIEPLETSSNLA